MSQLSGRPRLAGIVRRLASAQGPIQDSWEDKSTYLEGRVRKLRKGRAQLWPSWSLTIVATDAEWLAWRSDLRGDADGTFDWCPRTRTPDDPEWLEEHTFRARVQGGLPTLSPLRRRNAAGVYVYIVDVVIEGVEPYEVEPGAIDGGFTLDGEDDVSLALGTYGDATITDGPSQSVTMINRATGNPVTVTIESLQFGGPAIAAARITETPEDILIHTQQL